MDLFEELLEKETVMFCLARQAQAWDSMDN